MHRSFPMDESMILACKVMDRFGIGAAVVKVQVDRFLFANDCFLRVVGLTAGDLSTTSLLRIVNFPLKFRLELKPIPVAIRPCHQNLAVRGHFGVGKQGLAYVIVPSLFSQTVDLEKEQQWQQPATYRAGPVSARPDRVGFSIEFVRAQLRGGKNPVEAELEEIRDFLRVSKPG